MSAGANVVATQEEQLSAPPFHAEEARRSPSPQIVGDATAVLLPIIAIPVTWPEALDRAGSAAEVEGDALGLEKLASG